MSVALPPAPPTALRDGELLFGRYRGPIASPDLGIRGFSKLRVKEWHYTSVVSPSWFFGLSVAHLGFAASVFGYLVDRQNPGVSRELGMLIPLGLGLSFAPSPIEGRTVLGLPRSRLVIQGDSNGWDMEIDLPFDDVRLQGTLRVDGAAGLSMLFPLPGQRPAYTYKVAGLRARGDLRLGVDRVDLLDGLACVDWTRALTERETKWRWASLAHALPDGRRFGLNLSAQVYDDAAGVSQENAFFLDGEPTPLGAALFEVPRQPGVEDWAIRSRDDDSFDLRFTPLGARTQEIDLRVIRSDYVQPYGLFRGHVAGHVVDGAFGVVEDHFAVW